MNKLKSVYITINILATIVLLIAIPVCTFALNINLPYKILIVIYLFSIIPAYTYSILSLNKLTLEQSIKFGFRVGLLFGFDYIILPIILAPIFMVLYIFDIVEFFKKFKSINK